MTAQHKSYKTTIGKSDLTPANKGSAKRKNTAPPIKVKPQEQTQSPFGQKLARYLVNKNRLDDSHKDFEISEEDDLDQMIHEKKNKKIDGVLNNLGKVLGSKSKDDLRVMRHLQNDLDFRLVEKIESTDIDYTLRPRVRNSWANQQILRKDRRNIGLSPHISRATSLKFGRRA